jgi:hypothetical protein
MKLILFLPENNIILHIVTQGLKIFKENVMLSFMFIIQFVLTIDHPASSQSDSAL